MRSRGALTVATASRLRTTTQTSWGPAAAAQRAFTAPLPVADYPIQRLHQAAEPGQPVLNRQAFSQLVRDPTRSHLTSTMTPKHQAQALRHSRDVLQPLLDDHALVREVLSSMERRVVEERVGRAKANGFWQSAVKFFEGYIESCHHRFEDEHLFQSLTILGFAAQGSATRMARQEHERMDPFLQHLRHAVEHGEPCDLGATVQAFVALHRQHMEREEQSVFPLLRAALARETTDETKAAIEKLEADTHGERMSAERLVDEIRRLAFPS